MNREQLKMQLEVDEGLRLKPYRCTAGKLTIGIGRNLDDNGITRGEAMFMLDNDVAKCEIEMFREFPWAKGMSDRRQQALCNMLYNMGITRLKGFRKMLAFMKEGKYNEAADEMLNSKWAKQVGIRANRLAIMMRNG